MSSSDSEDETHVPAAASIPFNEMENCSDGVHKTSHSENIHMCDKCHSGECNYQNIICPIVQQTENGNPVIADVGKSASSLMDEIKQISGNEEVLDDRARGCHGEVINKDLSLVEVIEPAADAEPNPNATERVSTVNKSSNSSEHRIILDIAANNDVSSIFKFVEGMAPSIVGSSDANANFTNTSEALSKRPLIEEIGSTEHLAGAFDPIKENNDVENMHKLDDKHTNKDGGSELQLRHVERELSKCGQDEELGHREDINDSSEHLCVATDEKEMQESNEIRLKSLDAIDNIPEKQFSLNKNNENVCEIVEMGTEQLEQTGTTYMQDCVTYYCTDLKNFCENQNEDEFDSLSIETAENSEESRVNTPIEYDI